MRVDLRATSLRRPRSCRCRPLGLVSAAAAARTPWRRCRCRSVSRLRSAPRRLAGNVRPRSFRRCGSQKASWRLAALTNGGVGAEALRRAVPTCSDEADHRSGSNRARQRGSARWLSRGTPIVRPGRSSDVGVALGFRVGLAPWCRSLVVSVIELSASVAPAGPSLRPQVRPGRSSDVEMASQGYGWVRQRDAARCLPRSLM